MYRDPQCSRVLLFAGDQGPALQDALRSVWPEAQWEAGEVLAAHAAEALSEPASTAIVACTDALDAAELQLLQLFAGARPDGVVLLIVGSRGLAGAEGLLALDQVYLVPEPWTPRALRELSLRLGRRRGAAPLEGEASTGFSSVVAAPAVAGASVLDALSAVRDLQAETRDLVAEAVLRREEVLQSQALELARLRKSRESALEARECDALLAGVFQHRDRLADLLADAGGSEVEPAIASILRSLDDFLTTRGVLRDDRPDPDDARLARVTGRRARAAGDPSGDYVLRRPAFLRIEDGERRVLRPAEIELLYAPKRRRND